jgi:hypothetical protein
MKRQSFFSTAGGPEGAKAAQMLKSQLDPVAVTVNEWDIYD